MPMWLTIALGCQDLWMLNSKLTYKTCFRNQKSKYQSKKPCLNSPHYAPSQNTLLVR